MKTKQDIINYLTEEGYEHPEELTNLDAYDLIDTYLTWEGIIGYTDEIIEVVFSAYGLRNRNSRRMLKDQLQLTLSILQKHNLLEEYYVHNEEEYDESEPVDIDWEAVNNIEI